jgi:hypothetical protein
LTSLALADLKKRNAAALEEKRREELIAQGRYDGPPKPLDHEKPSYPKYAEFEVIGFWLFVIHLHLMMLAVLV